MKTLIFTISILISLNLAASNLHLEVSQLTTMAAISSYKSSSQNEKFSIRQNILQQLRQFFPSDYSLLSQELNSLESIILNSIEFDSKNNCNKILKNATPSKTERSNKYKCIKINSNILLKFNLLNKRLRNFVLPLLEDAKLNPNIFPTELLSDLTKDIEISSLIKRDIQNNNYTLSLKKTNYLINLTGK